MYESIIWVSLGQLIFAGILYAIHRQAIVLLVSSVLATIGLIAADSAPAVMDPGLHPLVPVLRSNYWLTIHVLTITLGYAAFALTLGLANVSLYYFLRSARAEGKADAQAFKVKVASMNQLTYRAMQFGVVLLAAGPILGGVWADYSWGRFWGWDPKEVWALIALLCYLTILHGRYSSWVGQFGFAAWSVIAFLSVLMAWYGVNFVLGVGLHSYGFASGGGFASIMAFVAVQMAYVGAVAWIVKRGDGRRGAHSHPAPAGT
jgi:cytochrome c-type biogenesis protein CcsB